MSYDLNTHFAKVMAITVCMYLRYVCMYVCTYVCTNLDMYAI